MSDKLRGRACFTPALAATPGKLAKMMKADADKRGAIGKKLGVKPVS